jgi:hypothetical protein
MGSSTKRLSGLLLDLSSFIRCSRLEHKFFALGRPLPYLQKSSNQHSFYKGENATHITDILDNSLYVACGIETPGDEDVVLFAEFGWLFQRRDANEPFKREDQQAISTTILLHSLVIDGTK